MGEVAINPEARSDAAMVTTALLRAAEALGVRQGTVAAIIGVSDSQVSRAKRGAGDLFPEGPTMDQRMEAALLFIRVYRSLHGLFGDNRALQRQWLVTFNRYLGGVPIELLQTIQGKVRCVDYLDAMRGQ